MTKTLRIAALLFLAHAAVAQQASLADWISTAEERVVGVAEAMPEAKYSFAPTNGEFKGVRTFAEQLKHVAANNYAMAAHIEGRKPAPDEASEEGPASVKTKDEIVSYIKGSFGALHKAMTRPNTANEKHDATWFAVDVVAHSCNHYGQLVEYLRMNGIVPPASR